MARTFGSMSHVPIGPIKIKPPRATAIQLVGTFYFNVMTFLALFDNWSVSQEDRLV